MANIAYIRVSSADQNEARQKDALKGYKIDKWYEEKVSGKNMDRPQLSAMLDYVRDGDTIYVLDFSRLARSTRDLLYIVDLLKEKNVRLVSVKESLDTSTPTGKLMLTMIAAINEFERQSILERQAEGIALAKKNGVYKGRKKVQPKNFPHYYELYMGRQITKTDIAKSLGISRPTVDRLIKEYRAEANGTFRTGNSIAVTEQ